MKEYLEEKDYDSMSCNEYQEFEMFSEKDVSKEQGREFLTEILEITENGYCDEEDILEGYNCTKKVTSYEELEFFLESEGELIKGSLEIWLEGFGDVPAKIEKLKNVKKLGISIGMQDETITLSLPTEFGNLKQLEQFCAYNCNMKSLPESFVNLANLKELNLNCNDFQVFPKEILELEKLESLAICSNYEILPDEICNLRKLKRLYLPGANITYLPENIGDLEELELLCIWGTKVKQLPNSCLKLSNIKSLYLTRSIFQDILPPEIIGQSPIEAIKYIISYQNDKEKIEVNESKMIIVGQGGVGKTCLLNRLIYNKYDETVSTEGIDIATWEFERNEKLYKLNVWDFGGQEIYHATHQFFLTNRSLYIFVWDARQEEEYGRIDYWLHTIESFASNSPIIIVVNKCDSRKSIKQLDLKSIKEKFPQIIDCFKVSCKENIEIENLRDAIKSETVNLPLMGMVWLSSWLEVRRELESLAKNTNIISYAEYMKICGKYNILADDALSLSKYLHDLGIIINFQNDLYLKNIVILNPDWGTNAVYMVLDAQETVLKNRNGILYYDDLTDIWKNTEVYPTEMYPIILRLMENFQLSFEVRKNKEYLVAELLESEEVKFEMQSSGKQKLNFQYNYDFLPAGILTRFIVKANSYLVEENGKKMCWKKGAYLKYQDSIGSVRLFDGISERRIEITIVGDDSRNNRELLIIIRKYFDEIHKSVPKIKYKEFVKCICNEKCSYLHEYQYLVRLERENYQWERCKKSLELVNVTKLLDGVNGTGRRRYVRRERINNIQVNPQFVFHNNNLNKNENSNTNVIHNIITIEIRNSINELQGNIADLKDEIIFENSEFENVFEKLENSMKKLNEVQTKDEVVSSGVLRRVKRFLEDIQDTESEIGKVVRGIKYGVEIVQDIADKYNCIAEWCGLPIVPKVFLKR